VNSIVITTAATLAGQVLTVLALWLQLRAQKREEHARRRLLVEVTRALSRGSQLPSDGSRAADGDG
jgi:hypothetical protein